MKKKQWYFATLFVLFFLLGLQISCDREESSCIPKCDAKFFTLTHFLNENINEGIVFVSMDGMIQEANQTYLDIIGYTLEEARQLSCEQITPLKWHKMENDLRINQVMKRGFCDIYEKDYIRKDETTVPIRTQAWLITDEYGEPWRIMGVIKEINPEN